MAAIFGYALGGVLVAGSVFYLAIKGRTSRKGIPEKMKAVRCVKAVVGELKGDLKEHFEVAEIDTPKPRAGQVLVRIERSPINPSDMGPIRGRGGKNEPLPATLGLEGCGTVVQSGGGFFGWRLNGKRVACISAGKGCMWSEYACVPAMTAVALPNRVSWDEGAAVFVNPLTVIAFVQIAVEGRHKYLIHTAAASALGKMLIRLARREGIEVVALVRKAAQKEDLIKNEGVKYVIDTSEEKWESGFRDLCAEKKIRLGFDAIAGEMSGTLLSNMPEESRLYVYGILSGRDVSGIRPLDIMYGGKQVIGFVLPRYLKTRSLMNQKAMVEKAVARIQDDLRTPVSARYPLTDVATALNQYMTNMSDGKVLIAPQSTTAEKTERKA